MDESGFAPTPDTNWPGLILSIIALALLAQVIIGWYIYRFAQRNAFGPGGQRKAVLHEIIKRIDEQTEIARRAISDDAIPEELVKLQGLVEKELKTTIEVGGKLAKLVDTMKAATTTLKVVEKRPVILQGHNRNFLVAQSSVSAPANGHASAVGYGSPAVGPATASATAAAGATSVSVSAPTVGVVPVGASMGPVGISQVQNGMFSVDRVFITDELGAYVDVSTLLAKVEVASERAISLEERAIASRKAMSGFIDYWSKHRSQLFDVQKELFGFVEKLEARPEGRLVMFSWTQTPDIVSGPAVSPNGAARAMKAPVRQTAPPKVRYIKGRLDKANTQPEVNNAPADVQHLAKSS